MISFPFFNSSVMARTLPSSLLTSFPRFSRSSSHFLFCHTKKYHLLGDADFNVGLEKMKTSIKATQNVKDLARMN